MEREDVQEFFCKNFTENFENADNYIGFSSTHQNTVEYKQNLSNIFSDKKIDEILDQTYPKDDRVRYICSSALLCVLTFYKLRTLQLPISDTILQCAIKNLIFEKTLSLGLHGRPPGIDLYIECENDTSIFFESKCAEYLSNNKGKLSKQYYPLITKIFNKTPIERYLHFTEDNTCLIYSDEENYYDGLKQMICHLLGVLQFAAEYPEKNIILSEIMYRFPNNIDSQSILWNRYNYLYQTFAEVTNSYLKRESIKNVNIIPHVISYQDIFNIEENRNQLNSLVRDLYLL